MSTLKRKRSSTGGSARPPIKRRKTYMVASRTSSTLAKSNTLLKTSQVATLRYALDFELDPAAAGFPAVHLFSANGVYDPDITGSGTQPRGFDQLMLLYRHYVVEESTIEIWADPSDLTNGGLISIAVKDGTDTVTRKGVLEETVATYKAMSGSNGGPSVAYLKMSCKPHQYLGSSLRDDANKGSAVANPADNVIYSVTAFPNNSGADAGKVYCVGRITYKVRFLEPTRPPDS